jgi:hypothetical protein
MREEFSVTKFSGVRFSPTMSRFQNIEILTENDGWAIIWLFKKYCIKHLPCGTVLFRNAKNGCRCKRLPTVECKCAQTNEFCSNPGCTVYPGITPVDPIIYGKWRIMTLRDPELRGKV